MTHLVTINELALLAMQRKLHTIRFASDGRTAVVKYYIGRGTQDQMLVEKRIAPSAGSDGVERYDVGFLEFSSNAS